MIIKNVYGDVIFDGENFEGADLKYSDLRDANFKNANLAAANFQGSILFRANFENASLRFAGLEDTNLREANFKNANLGWANLLSANLTDANFEGANLDFVQFSLRCTIFDMQIDERLFAQFAYHLCRMKCDSEKVKKVQDSLRTIANTSHLIPAHGCSKIESFIKKEKK